MFQLGPPCPNLDLHVPLWVCNFMSQSGIPLPTSVLVCTSMSKSLCPSLESCPCLCVPVWSSTALFCPSLYLHVQVFLSQSGAPCPSLCVPVWSSVHESVAAGPNQSSVSHFELHFLVWSSMSQPGALCPTLACPCLELLVPVRSSGMFHSILELYVPVSVFQSVASCSTHGKKSPYGIQTRLEDTN